MPRLRRGALCNSWRLLCKMRKAVVLFFLFFLGRGGGLFRGVVKGLLCVCVCLFIGPYDLNSLIWNYRDSRVRHVADIAEHPLPLHLAKLLVIRSDDKKAMRLMQMSEGQLCPSSKPEEQLVSDPP